MSVSICARTQTRRHVAVLFGRMLVVFLATQAALLEGRKCGASSHAELISNSICALVVWWHTFGCQGLTHKMYLWRKALCLFRTSWTDDVAQRSFERQKVADPNTFFAYFSPDISVLHQSRPCVWWQEALRCQPLQGRLMANNAIGTLGQVQTTWPSVMSGRCAVPNGLSCGQESRGLCAVQRQ